MSIHRARRSTSLLSGLVFLLIAGCVGDLPRVRDGGGGDNATRGHEPSAMGGASDADAVGGSGEGDLADGHSPVPGDAGEPPDEASSSSADAPMVPGDDARPRTDGPAPARDAAVSPVDAAGPRDTMPPPPETAAPRDTPSPPPDLAPPPDAAPAPPDTSPAPTCSDGTRNGSETDIDCGGTCRRCFYGETCASKSDCPLGGGCPAGRCEAEVVGIWDIKNPPHVPSSDQSPAISYDPKLHGVILFGGYAGQVGQNDTWLWKDGDWSRVTTTTPPPSGRCCAGMTLDSDAGVSYLFGGTAGSGASQEFWRWDGGDRSWTLLPVSGDWPGARVYTELAYDSRRQRVILFGGGTGTESSGDIWEWDGSGWHQAMVAGPAGRTNPVLVYDAARGQTVLHAGASALEGANQVKYYDTWVWDGSRWQEKQPEHVPAHDAYPAAAYDSRRGRVILYEMDPNSTPTRSTWEWDGTDWHLTSSDDGPMNPKYGNVMAYDPELRRTVYRGYGMVAEYYSVGETCGSNGDCDSGHCVDGVCCRQSACNGLCSACDTPESPGQCAPVRSRQDRDSCGGGMTCNAVGACVTR